MGKLNKKGKEKPETPLMLIAKKALTGSHGGRPRKYKTAHDLRKEVLKYFQYCSDSFAAPTISGLSLFCGFDSRQSFYDYGKKEKFAYTIGKARLIIETVYESRLHGSNSKGAEFALKNMGWDDKKQIEEVKAPEKQIIMIGETEIEF